MEADKVIEKIIELNGVLEEFSQGQYPDLHIGLIDLTKYPYEQWHQSLTWNEDHSTEDLESREGNTYSIEINWIVYESEKYLVVDGDDGCGDRHSQYLFKKSMCVLS